MTTGSSGRDRAPAARGSDTVPSALPRAVHDIGVAAFVDEAASRNRDVLSEQEQAALRAARVLVAGCGSVGGAVVEPLVRLGVGSLVLADPDVFEVSNLNRQACVATDVGRPKVDVLADRARAINPLVEVRTLPEGLTEENLRDALAEVGVVFDGIDPGMSGWVKYRLHEASAERRVPVLAGVDIGGQPLLGAFDYRRDARPYFGRASAEAHRRNNFVGAVAWLPWNAIPADFAPVVLRRLREPGPWPQLAYTVSGMGALACRAVVDLLMGRDLAFAISADLHALTRTRRERLRRALRQPVALLRTGLALRSASRRGGLPAGTAPARRALPAELRAVLEAIRRAPSPHNTQPWRLTPTAHDAIRISTDPKRRLDAADPTGAVGATGIGCAIEAAATIAHLDFHPDPAADCANPGWTVGELRIKHLRGDGYFRASGLLGARGTHRDGYLTEPLAPETLEDLGAEARRFDVELCALSDRRRISRLARLTRDAAVESLRDPTYLAELLRWIRLSGREFDWDADGFTPETLRLDPLTVRLLATMKRYPAWRRFASEHGVARVIGAQTADAMERVGALVLLASDDTSAQGLIRGGRAMMRVWLAATRRGLAVQPVHFALSLDHFAGDVMRGFGAPPSHRAVTLLRIGRARGAPPRSQRLPLDRICKFPDPG